MCYLLVLACTAKPKKPTKEERIAEKKAKRRAEEKSLEPTSEASNTAEEAFEEKQKQQRLQEESDLALAMETFGVKDKLIDTMEPKSEEEFSEFQELLTAKITKFEVSYVQCSLLVIVVVTSGELDPNSSFNQGCQHLLI